MEMRDRRQWSDGELNPVRFLKRSTKTVMEVHHSAGPRSNNDERSISLIRSYYKLHVNQNGWSDLFYHYVIDDRGVVWEGRDPGTISSDNPQALAVMLLGNYDVHAPTEEQKAAILELNEQYSFTESIDWHAARADRYGRYHSACPGKNVIDWLKTYPKKETTVATMTQTAAEYHVNWCYDKILGRKADPGGLAYWSKRLVEGSINVPNMRWEFQAVKNAALSAGGGDVTRENKFVKDLIDLAKDA